MTEETPSLETADEAYAKAKAGFELFDKPLYAYSFTRKSAANRMGLIYGYVDDDDPIHRASKKLRYSGDIGDTVKVLWLCSIPNASEQSAEERKENGWTVQRAERKPDEAYAAAQEWAESHGITDGLSDQFWKAYAVFLDIILGNDKAVFSVAVDSVGPAMPTDAEDPNE